MCLAANQPTDAGTDAVTNFVAWLNAYLELVPLKKPDDEEGPTDVTIGDGQKYVFGDMSDGRLDAVDFLPGQTREHINQILQKAVQKLENGLPFSISISLCGAASSVHTRHGRATVLAGAHAMPPHAGTQQPGHSCIRPHACVAFRFAPPPTPCNLFPKAISATLVRTRAAFASPRRDELSDHGQRGPPRGRRRAPGAPFFLLCTQPVPCLTKAPSPARDGAGRGRSRSLLHGSVPICSHSAGIWPRFPPLRQPTIKPLNGGVYRIVYEEQAHVATLASLPTCEFGRLGVSRVLQRRNSAFAIMQLYFVWVWVWVWVLVGVGEVGG